VTRAVRLAAASPDIQGGHELFDHPTLIKTILLRFAANPEQAITPDSQPASHEATAPV
jgi:hypothetical protein